ncbi:MAG: cyanophycinase [Saprospiraceae bacterium]|nr:cyanophycinase [Saprospiraceae bacterium]
MFIHLKIRLEFLIFALHCIPFYLNGQGYEIYHTGSAIDTITSPMGGICMMGGRRENDEAMKWFLNRANEGDVVILRASGSDGYNDYFYENLGIHLNSVTSIVFKSRDASYNHTIQAIVNNAEAIWMAGGNQWNYVRYWRDSPIDSIINQNIKNKNIVIGGTSAGMAILGNIYFSASKGTVTSEECLSNPLLESIDVDHTHFLSIPFLENVITDTHYDERDRQGRHAVFMARALKDYGLQVRGIACDEYTALCIDRNGIARAYGNYPEKDDQVYFIQLHPNLRHRIPEQFTENQAFTWNRLQAALMVYKLPGSNDGSYFFDLNNWNEGMGGIWQEWRIKEGLLIIDQVER